MSPSSARSRAADAGPDSGYRRRDHPALQPFASRRSSSSISSIEGDEANPKAVVEWSRKIEGDHKSQAVPKNTETVVPEQLRVGGTHPRAGHDAARLQARHRVDGRTEGRARTGFGLQHAEHERAVLSAPAHVRRRQTAATADALASVCNAPGIALSVAIIATDGPTDARAPSFSCSIHSASAMRPDAERLRRCGVRHARPHRGKLRARRGRQAPAFARVRSTFPTWRGSGFSTPPPSPPDESRPRMASTASSAPRRRFRAARTRPPATGRWPAFPSPSTGAISPRRTRLFRRSCRRGHRGRRRSRHSRQLPRIGHRHHRAPWRGAHPHRQADLLHLGRQSSSRSPRMKTHFGLERLYDALRRQCAVWSIRSISAASSRAPSSARLPIRSSARPTARDYAVPPPEPTLIDRRDRGRRPVARRRQDRRHLRPSRHLAPAQGARQHGDVRRGAGGDGRRQDGDLVFANFVDFDTLYGHRRDVPATPLRSRPSTGACRRHFESSARAIFCS